MKRTEMKRVNERNGVDEGGRRRKKVKTGRRGEKGEGRIALGRRREEKKGWM